MSFPLLAILSRHSFVPVLCLSSSVLSRGTAHYYGFNNRNAEATASAFPDPACFTPTYGNAVTARNFGLGGCKFFFSLQSTHVIKRQLCIRFLTMVLLPSLLRSGRTAQGLHDESLEDLSYRAVHVSALLGNKIVPVYHGASPHHPYWNGCSDGGRQGIAVACRYPDVFDGVLVGSPVVDWNRLVGAIGIWASFVTANTPSVIILPNGVHSLSQVFSNSVTGR